MSISIHNLTKVAVTFGHLLKRTGNIWGIQNISETIFLEAPVTSVSKTDNRELVQVIAQAASQGGCGGNCGCGC